MEYDLVTRPTPDHLYARVRAVEITPEIAARLLRETKDALIDARSGRLLLECEIAHTLNESEAFTLVEQLRRIMPGLRIALVNRDARHFPSFRLSVGLAISSGEDHAFFADPAAAREWLVQDR